MIWFLSFSLMFLMFLSQQQPATCRRGNFARRRKESITITDDDLRKCANAVKHNSENESEVYKYCNKIFSRGVWDSKADRTLDGDISRLIELIFDGKKENLGKVLNFIDEQVPKYVRERIVCYNSVINEFEGSEDFNLPEFQPYFQRIKTAVAYIRMMNGSHPAANYKLASERHQHMLEDIEEYIENIDKIAKRQSITVTYQDLVNCSDTLKFNLENQSLVDKSCNNIFYRGVWDKKADMTLDKDIRTLIRLTVDGKSENIIRILYFIETFIPKYVRERIVSFDAVMDEFEKAEDFHLPVNKYYFKHIKKDVEKIKKLKGVTPAYNYQMAKQMHKDILEYLLKKLNKLLETDIFFTEDVDIQKCANSVNFNNEYEVSCSNIFNRTISDGKINKELHRDIRKLIHFMYDDKRENILKVLDFIDKYVPKYVPELILSYDAIIYEFEKNEDFNLEINQPYFKRIKRAIEDIENMRGKLPAENYKLVPQKYKDMLENMLENLNAVAEDESTSRSDQDIEKCANSFRDNLKNEFEILIPCYKMFNKGIRDEEVNNAYDDSIKKLIEFIYDHKRENLLYVLYFIDAYVPKRVRELVVSYYAIVNEFEKHDDFNYPLNQWYFLKVKQDVADIKKMNGEGPGESYELAPQVYKDMLEETLEKLSVVRDQESITVTVLDIQNCAHAVKVDLETSEIQAACSKIFYRGIWDGKADGTLDGDIKKLIQIIFDRDTKNFPKTFHFIQTIVPKNVRELIVSYYTLVNEFEKNDDFDLPENQPYVEQIKKAAKDIRHMNGTNPAQNYKLALKIHKRMLNDILKRFIRVLPKESVTITEEDLQNCANAVNNDQEVLASCFRIFSRGVWDAKADRTLDGDTNKLMKLIFDGKIERVEKVLDFVYTYVPRYVRELIVSYDAIVSEFERSEDIDLEKYRPYLRQIERDVIDIKGMKGDHPAENYEYTQEKYKRMLKDTLTRLNELI